MIYIMIGIVIVGAMIFTLIFFESFWEFLELLLDIFTFFIGE